MKVSLFFAWLPGVAAVAAGAAAQADRPGRVYLGNVTDKAGQVVYQVVTRFYTVPAARVRQGHSEVVFLGPTGQPVATYAVGLPADLPVALRGNVLYFRAPVAGRVPHRQVIDPAAPLPRQLCVAPNDCYYKN